MVRSEARRYLEPGDKEGSLITTKIGQIGLSKGISELSLLVIAHIQIQPCRAQNLESLFNMSQSGGGQAVQQL